MIEEMKSILFFDLRRIGIDPLRAMALLPLWILSLLLVFSLKLPPITLGTSLFTLCFFSVILLIKIKIDLDTSLASRRLRNSFVEFIILCRFRSELSRDPRLGMDLLGHHSDFHVSRCVRDIKEKCGGDLFFYCMSQEEVLKITREVAEEKVYELLARHSMIRGPGETLEENFFKEEI